MRKPKKLNLWLDKDLVDRARAEAARLGTDLSGLIKLAVFENRTRAVAAGQHASLRFRLRMRAAARRAPKSIWI